MIRSLNLIPCTFGQIQLFVKVTISDLFVCIEFAINIRGDVTDFDADGYLNASDMEVALKYITNGELEQEELDYITSKIIGR